VALRSRDKRAAARAKETARRTLESVIAATLTATVELLSESGFGGVSVDEVSRRSGVAKTTIYRHWPNRTALLLDACSKLTPRPQAPDTGRLQDDLEGLALTIANRVQTGRWSSVIPSIIDAAERDPATAELHSRLHAGMMSAFKTVIARARERGEVAGDRDPSEIAASIVGPLFYRRWFSREPLDEAFVRDVVKRAMN
jgi:AcrR family transcriptional regulator